MAAKSRTWPAVAASSGQRARISFNGAESSVLRLPGAVMIQRTTRRGFGGTGAVGTGVAVAR
jgi:hypothetical protein